MGGDSSNPTWEEYLVGWTEERHQHLEVLKQFITENGLIGTTGEAQNDWTFKFSDGWHIGFSWRAWGDLMQAVVGKREGYLTYYM